MITPGDTGAHLTAYKHFQELRDWHVGLFSAFKSKPILGLGRAEKTEKNTRIDLIWLFVKNTP